ncbi:hypothetical protein CgunFtcFv8_014864 [Champsocephalus gunnari]|uniref:Uncharacterized protein n=1 Tax=Champsocephalus gunnari TaxID=52237 RepID=A0AAN8E3E2_CHAGU|nr:hypothetical protein CgunFtcFv8_014864 [Champsocephalus gunnari]
MRDCVGDLGSALDLISQPVSKRTGGSQGRGGAVGIMMGDMEPLTECCRSIRHVLEMNYLDASSASCSIDPSYSL